MVEYSYSVAEHSLLVVGDLRAPENPIGPEMAAWAALLHPMRRNNVNAHMIIPVKAAVVPG